VTWALGAAHHCEQVKEPEPARAMSTGYNPDALYAFYKQARNHLRKFDPGSCVARSPKRWRSD
jgi:hypothetical protein